MARSSEDGAARIESTLRLRIEGMTCGGCVARVERALQSVDGVRRAQVNLTTQLATIETGASPPNRQLLLDAVRQAGYAAEPVRPADATKSSPERTYAAKLQHQKQSLWQAITLTIPIMALHWLAPHLVSGEIGGHVWPTAIQALLTLVLLGSSAGAPILVSGLHAVIRRSPNMDLLIAIGVSVAFVAGAVNLILGHADHAEFHAAAMILAFINLGRYLEMRAKHGAATAVSALMRRMPATANLVRPEGIQQVPIEQLQPGDRIRVAQDTVIPVDGVVVEGEAAIDESSLTGEPMPRSRRVGEEVASGGVVREGMITVEATRAASESAMGRIVRAVEEAQSGKTRMQRIADQVAGFFVPVVVALATMTLLGTVLLGFGDWSTAVQRAVAVLVIACPCAMGLATPTAVMVATGRAALDGILVRDASALEAAGRVSVVLLDKTGTLTTGRPEVRSLLAISINRHEDEGDQSRDAREKELLAIAASVEQYSQHPLARAIVAEAQDRGVRLREPQDFRNTAGRGVTARLDGEVAHIGSASFIRDQGIDLSSAESAIYDVAENGDTVVVVSKGGRCVGVIAIADALRPNAVEMIEELGRLGIVSALVTGDNERTAAAVAKAVGIEEVHAEASPEDKLRIVRERQNQGSRVAFAGDGLNDAPALAAADVGLTFASASDVAVGAADITIVHDDLTRIPEAVRLARRSVRIIKQNLFWAFAYNFAAIPLAATGHVPPGAAAAAMMFSSISVVLNSLRLRR